MSDLINERELSHGPFKETASRYVDLMEGIRHDDMGVYTAEQHAALSMICMKIARIAAGNSDEPDHWQDIIGYAELALASIRRARS